MNLTRTQNRHKNKLENTTPFFTNKTDVMHSTIYANRLSFQQDPLETRYVESLNATAYIRYFLLLTQTSDQNITTFSLTCRQGRVLLVNCNAPQDAAHYYKATVSFIRDNEVYNGLGVYSLNPLFMNTRVCPILGSGSPYITSQDQKIQTKAAMPFIGTDANKLNTIINDPVNYTGIISETLHLHSHDTTQKTELQTLNQSLVELNTISYGYKPQELQRLDCENKGYATDLLYKAKSWEAFVCESNTQPKLTVAICGPDGMMHTASFVKDLFPDSVDSFKLEEQGSYKCFIQDPLWTQYSKAMQKQGITENQLQLDSSIYPAIKNTNIPVTSCQVLSSTNITQAPCSITLQFNRHITQNTKGAFAEVDLYSTIPSTVVWNAQINSAVKTDQMINNNTSLNITDLSHCPHTTHLDPLDNNPHASAIALASVVGVFALAFITVLSCVRLCFSKTQIELPKQIQTRRKHQTPPESSVNLYTRVINIEDVEGLNGDRKEESDNTLNTEPYIQKLTEETSRETII